MSKASGLTHILTELSSLDELGRSLKRSSRLKFTGISVSRRYLALGSSRGDAHIFARDTLKYLQVIFLEKETNPIVSLALSPTEQHVGVASSSGFVAVFELNIDKRAKPEKVRQSLNHSGHTVTSFVWDGTGTKLFVGDDQGKISLVSVPTNKSKTIFSLPSEILAVLNVGICQMTWWQDKLLVSTLMFCYLFDTVRHTYSTIGTKKREGEFGACIFLEPNSQCPVIYCARPGSRMWEVDFSGTVLNTHQFKQLLSIPPVTVVSILHDSYTPSTKVPAQGGLSVAFNKMIHVGHLILTWSAGGLYLFDPINVKVMIWTDSYKDIKDAAVFGNEVYLFHENSKISKVAILPIYQAFQVLVARCKWNVMADLLLASDHINIQPAILKRVKKDLMENLITGLMEIDDIAMVEKIRVTMEDVSEGSVDSLNFTDDWIGSTEILGYTRLPSGMIIVNDGSSSRASPIPNFDHSGKFGEPAGKDEYKEPFSSKDLRRALSPLWREEKQKEVLSVVIENHQSSYGLEENSYHETKGLKTKEIKAEGGEPEVNDEQHKDSMVSVKAEKDTSHSIICNEKEESIAFDKQDVTNGSNELTPHWKQGEGQHKRDLEAEISPDSQSLEDDTVHEKAELEGRGSTTSGKSDLGEIPFPEVNLYDEAPEKSKVYKNTMDSLGSEVDETLATTSKVNSGADTNSDLTDMPRETKSSTDKGDNSHTSATAEGKHAEIFPHVKAEKGWMNNDNDPEVEGPYGDPDPGLRSELAPFCPANRPGIKELTSMGQWTRNSCYNWSTGDKEVIFESVKPIRKKKRRKGPQTNVMARSMSFQKLPTKDHLHISLSCSDLSEKTLYDCCDNEEAHIKLGIDDANEAESEQSDGSIFFGRKVSAGSVELRPVMEEQAHATSQKEKQTEVIPPLIDRLAAARSHSHVDENVIEDDLVDYLMSQKTNLLAIKDGLSSKLKTQTKSLLNKGKTLLVKTASSPPSSSSFLDSYKSSREDSVPHMDTLEPIKPLPEPKTEKNGSLEKSENREILATLSNQIESLCLKAMRIEGQLKNHSLLLNPSRMGQLLEEWASALNQVSHEFHFLQWKKKWRNKVKDKRPDKESADATNDLTNSLETSHDNGWVGEREENSDSSDTDSVDDSSDNIFDDDETVEEKAKLAKQKNAAVEEDENVTALSNPEYLSDASVSYIPVEYLRGIIQATDPFHLPVEQLEVFQSLTTLCLLSGTMGDISDVFHLCEPERVTELLQSFAPDKLHHLFRNVPEIRLTEKEFPSDKTGLHSDSIDSSLMTVKQSGHNVGFSNANLNSKLPESAEEKTVSDLHRALFLRLHFFAVDYARVKEEFDKRQDDSFLYWIALVHCCQEKGKRDIINSLLADNQVNSAIDHLRSGILLHPSALLGHIYSLFDRAPSKTSEFCGEMPSKISASDIIHLCQLTSRPPSDALLRYAKKVLINLAVVHRVAGFTTLCEHPMVRYHLLESLVPVMSFKYVEISQGDTAKSPVLQFVNLLPPGWMRLILAMIGSDEERESIIELGIKQRHWKLCVELLATSRQRSRMFRLVAGVGDLGLLQGHCLPQSVDEWRILFRHCIENTRKGMESTGEQISSLVGKKSEEVTVKDDERQGGKVITEPSSLVNDVENSKQSSATDEHIAEFSQQDADSSPHDSAQRQASVSTHLPRKAISLTDLGLCVLRNAGGVVAVDLLMEFLKELEEEKESLDPVLLNRCYTDFRILRMQDHLCHEALERMSVYMWTQQPTSLPPSVHHVVKSEASGRVNSEDELMSQISRLKLTSAEDFREEHVGTHWGHSMDIKRKCPSCTIPLNVSLTLDIPGVIIFPCGHGFHKRCVNAHTCPLMH